MMLSFQFLGGSHTWVNHTEVVNGDDAVGAEHYQLLVFGNVEKEDLGLGRLEARVRPDLETEHLEGTLVK